MSAAHFKLDNLIVIIDQNQLQLDGKIVDIMDQGSLADKWKSFGEPDLIVCDGPQELGFICEELGLSGDYVATAYIGKGKRILKDKCDTYDVYVMCTKDTYKEIYGKEYEVPKY